LKHSFPWYVPARYKCAWLSLIEETKLRSILKAYNTQSSWCVTLMGPVGTSKTFCGCALINYYGGEFVSCNPLNIDEFPKQTTMIDDIGSSDKNIEEVSALIEKLYNRRQRTIITINDWRVLTERAKSRLNEGDIIQFSGKDMRGTEHLGELKRAQNKLVNNWIEYDESKRESIPSFMDRYGKDVAERSRNIRNALAKQREQTL
jgi:hypothetical protein